MLRRDAKKDDDRAIEFQQTLFRKCDCPDIAAV
jgi:hypothetical protein